MPTRAAIDAFLTSPRIAVVGVSRNPKAFANAVYRHLRNGDREVVAVNPHAVELEGDPCAATVADIDGDLDGVLVMVDAERALAVVEDCIARGVPRVWLHRGAGQGAVSDDAVTRCREADIDVIDGACPLMYAEPVGLFHRIHRLIDRRRITA